MHCIVLVATVLICTSPVVAATNEIFLSCTGWTSKESHGSTTNFLDDKISIKIDLKDHTFSWSPDVALTKSCQGVSPRDLLKELCSNVWATSDLEYQFELRLDLTSFTEGTIDRVSGEMHARTEMFEWDENKKEARLYAVTMRKMKCVPAAQQF
jgi:hypothetical protein